MKRRQPEDDAPKQHFLERPLIDYYLILISSALLIGLGIMMVLSSSTPYAGGNPNIDSPYAFAIRQFIFLIPGILITWWLSRRRPAFLMRFGWLGIGLAIALLSLVAFLAMRASGGAIGARGNTNWLSITSQIAIQPSEFAKLALVLWAAGIFAKRAKLLDQPKQLLVPFVPVVALVVALVLLGKDLGTAMVMGFIVLSILWFIGTPLRILSALGAVAAALVGVLALGNANRMTRIMVWLGAQHDSTDISAQPMAALFALASGGWWGVGLGAGKQKWGNLKDGAHTDFIFAVIGEELGFVGVLLVLILFATLGFAGLRIALHSDHPFTRTLAAGLTSWFMVQAVINIMVVLNLLPVLGIPLPFISYGGSSLVANMMGLGMLMACARNEPDARKALAARKQQAVPRVARLVDVGSRR